MVRIAGQSIIEGTYHLMEIHSLTSVLDSELCPGCPGSQTLFGNPLRETEFRFCHHTLARQGTKQRFANRVPKQNFKASGSSEAEKPRIRQLPARAHSPIRTGGRKNPGKSLRFSGRFQTESGNEEEKAGWRPGQVQPLVMPRQGISPARSMPIVSGNTCQRRTPRRRSPGHRQSFPKRKPVCHRSF